MVRAKPSLFLTVPNALDAHTYSRADLITPPCYVVSAPPPMLTPALSRSSSISMNSSRSESDCEFDEDDEEISLKTDAAPWTIDQDQALLSTYSAHLDRPSLPSAPFEASRPPPTIAAKISRNAIRNHGWQGRSVSSTRRRLLKLARDRYHRSQEDRMDIDPLDSSSALSSMARTRSHPYARFDQSFTSPCMKDLQMHGLPLASPFHEKQFDIPSSPSPDPSSENRNFQW